MSSNWGGRREGAGRKKRGEGCVTISVSIERAMLDAIDAQRGEQTRSRFIEEVVAGVLKGREPET